MLRKARKVCGERAIGHFTTAGNRFAGLRMWIFRTEALPDRHPRVTLEGTVVVPQKKFTFGSLYDGKTYVTWRAPPESLTLLFLPSTGYLPPPPFLNPQPSILSPKSGCPSRARVSGRLSHIGFRRWSVSAKDTDPLKHRGPVRWSIKTQHIGYSHTRDHHIWCSIIERGF